MLRCYGLKNGEKKFNIKALIAVVVFAAVISGLVFADFIKSRQEYICTDIAMNTVINFKLYGTNGRENAAELSEEIKAMDSSLFSRYEDGSDIGRVNASEGEAVSVSPEVLSVIETAVDVADNCGGVFDVTVGKVTELWGFGGENQRIPSAEELSDLLPYVGYTKMKISGAAITLGENQALDLGAVGKGAACDIIRTRLDSMSTDSAVISVGGSLLLYGKRDFSIGIANPDNNTQSMGTLKLSDTCVSTSGDYEQCFEQDGKTYHHILSAVTGRPAASHLRSVTVVCDSGVLSDALSTACFILGYNDSSLALLKKYNAEAIFITSDNIVRCTDGIKKDFELTDSTFTLGK